jgi:hypothetical protein
LGLIQVLFIKALDRILLAFIDWRIELTEALRYR